MPGIATLIPDLVSTRQIPAAVSLNSMAQTSSRIVGPALLRARSLRARVSLLFWPSTQAIMSFDHFSLLPFEAIDSEKNDLPLSRRRFFDAITEGLRYCTAATTLEAEYSHPPGNIFRLRSRRSPP